MKNLITVPFLCTINFIFSQSYFITVAKQINFRKYSCKKIEMDYEFLFLNFISVTEISQSFKKSKAVFYWIKLYRSYFGLEPQ